MTLSKALVEARREIEAARGDDANRRRALAHFDELTSVERANVLSVGDDDGRFVLGDETNHLVVGDDDRTVNREVRRHRRQNHHGQRRFDDRPPAEKL